MEIQPLGDSALLVRLFLDDREREDRIDLVRDVQERIRSANLPGVEDVTAAYGTIALYYDAAKVVAAVGGEAPFAALSAQVTGLLAARAARSIGKAQTVELPVCYEMDFAPDLAAVASHTGLAPEEVGARHASASYRVNCVGFTPGFPYLSGLPPELATPRRASPRTEVPAGSIAIGGAQTGIYPTASPGGWNVIGRTPRRLFEVTREPPALLAMGDTVRFRAITRAEFEGWVDSR